MAWSRLSGESAEVTVKDTGKIHWNDAAHVALGAPQYVHLFHDVETGKLGIRKCHGRAADALAVSVEEGEFVIGSSHHLDGAGIDYEDQFSVELQAPTPFTPPDGEGDSAIWWIELP